MPTFVRVKTGPSGREVFATFDTNSGLGRVTEGTKVIAEEADTLESWKSKFSNSSGWKEPADREQREAEGS